MKRWWNQQSIRTYDCFLVLDARIATAEEARYYGPSADARALAQPGVWRTAAALHCGRAAAGTGLFLAQRRIHFLRQRRGRGGAGVNNCTR